MGTASERAESRLREMIAEGRFMPGDRLPREDDLAAEIGVSKGTLRGAVAALVGVGALRVRQGDGTYVSELDAEHLLKPLAVAMPLLSDQTVAELYQFRALVEPNALARAIPNFTDHVDSRLTELVEQMEAASHDLEAYIDLDDEFHATLLAVLGNRVLSELMRLVAVQARRARFWRVDTDPESVATANLDHRAILDAILERDAEAARSALYLHLRDGERWLRLAMQHAPGQRLGVRGAEQERTV